MSKFMGMLAARNTSTTLSGYKGTGTGYLGADADAWDQGHALAMPVLGAVELGCRPDGIAAEGLLLEFD